MYNYFVGIDFSKETFDGTILRRNYLLDAGSHKQFKNNKTGLKSFKSWIRKETGSENLNDILVCGENTGIYSKLISDSLATDGYSMWLESPLRIHRSLGISREKNDKKDSHDIAEYAARHADKLQLHHPLSSELEALKVLHSERRQLVLQKGSIERRHGELKESTKNNEWLKDYDRRTERITNLLNEEIKEIEKDMEEIINDTEELQNNYDILTSMKGIGLVNAVAMLVCTENFERFDYNPRRICSFWGVAPFGHTSGTSINGRPHVSPFADKYLKSLLSEATMSAMRFCPKIRSYAQRLFAKGKDKDIVKNNCKNKVLHILVAMVKNKTKYGEVSSQEKEEENEK